MSLVATIEAGATDFTLLSSDQNRAVYRVEDLTLPPMFRRTLTLTAKPNNAGTNVNVAFKLVTPVISTVNGVQTIGNRRVISGSYTSLQNVLDPTDGADITDMAATLLALKPNFVNGSFS